MTTSDDAREPDLGSTSESTDADISDADSGKKVKKKKQKDGSKKGPFARFALFLRQVVAELRKVIWPTRSELVNYTIVVLIFIVIMAAILALYDFVFARLMFWIFGG